MSVYEAMTDEDVTSYVDEDGDEVAVVGDMEPSVWPLDVFECRFDPHYAGNANYANDLLAEAAEWAEIERVGRARCMAALGIPTAIPTRARA